MFIPDRDDFVEVRVFQIVSLSFISKAEGSPHFGCCIEVVDEICWLRRDVNHDGQFCLRVVGSPRVFLAQWRPSLHPEFHCLEL